MLELLLAAALAAPAPPCRGGETIFQEGPLRIFGVHYRDADEFGWYEFACRNGRKRAEVGGHGFSTGVASVDTPAYALGGSRYLGSYWTSDSEGGPDAHFEVTDLRTGRAVAFLNTAFGDGVPSFRVAADGTLVAGGAIKRRGRKPVRIGGRDPALTGGTVYWTAGAQARSTVLPGVGGGESRMFEPVRVHRRRGPCISARGTTVAAWPHVRVVRRGGKLFACRDRSSRRIRLNGVPRIAGDRWLLDGERLIDAKTDRVVTRGVGAPATLLRGGTVAWLDAGRLLLAAPGGAPVELSAAASALASGRRTIYWTEAGQPRSFATSASKPG